RLGLLPPVDAVPGRGMDYHVAAERRPLQADSRLDIALDSRKPLEHVLPGHGYDIVEDQVVPGGAEARNERPTDVASGSREQYSHSLVLSLLAPMLRNASFLPVLPRNIYVDGGGGA